MTELQAPEATPGKHSWGGSLWLVAVITILALLFLLPGFVEGFYSRATGRRLFPPYSSTHNRALDAYVYPAKKLAEISPAMKEFYLWEFRMAGGKVVLISF